MTPLQYVTSPPIYPLSHPILTSGYHFSFQQYTAVIYVFSLFFHFFLPFWLLDGWTAYFLILAYWSAQGTNTLFSTTNTKHQLSLLFNKRCWLLRQHSTKSWHPGYSLQSGRGARQGGEEWGDGEAWLGCATSHRERQPHHRQRVVLEHRHTAMGRDELSDRTSSVP